MSKCKFDVILYLYSYRGSILTSYPSLKPVEEKVWSVKHVPRDHTDPVLRALKQGNYTGRLNLSHSHTNTLDNKPAVPHAQTHTHMHKHTHTCTNTHTNTPQIVTAIGLRAVEKDRGHNSSAPSTDGNTGPCSLKRFHNRTQRDQKAHRIQLFLSKQV